MALLLARYRSS